MSNLPLKVFAGVEALQHIRDHGLQPDDIQVVLGASGGPKWLALAAMDRYLLSEWFKHRTEPLHLLGTSAGAWRLSCFARNEPLAAHQRFLEAYVSQRYSAKPTPLEVAAECRRMLDLALGEQGISEILEHPFMRYHTLVTRCRGLTASDTRWLQTAGWLGAIGANLLSRKRLHWRTASREHYRRTIIVAPSWEFAATLPGGRIPDLDDFYDFDYPQRCLRWEQALAACEALADALDRIHSQQRWAEIAEPLPW